MKHNKKQPEILKTLFFTEMWERFSYYGMRALLILYLVNQLQYPREQALQLYATYVFLVYFTPIIGGYIADRYLGRQRAVLVGGVVMALGHFAMAFPSLLHLALGLLVAGNGFFKPNISTMVGGLYELNDTRRDAGFTLFYMGINLGAFLAPLVCGSLGEMVAWHYGFAAAGVGMVTGLLVFVTGVDRIIRKQEQRDGELELQGALKLHSITSKDWYLVVQISALVVLLVGLIVLGLPLLDRLQQQFPLFAIFVCGVSLLVFISITQYWRDSHDTIGVRRMLALVIVGVFVIFFWMGFEQGGGTMSLFADKQTDRDMAGWLIPASYFQSLNPLFILLFAPLFSVMWMRLDQSRFALSSINKQALGMIILGCGFVVLAIAQSRAELVGQVSPMWLVMVFLLHTLGELCLSPIGLSMVTKLSPVKLVSMMMGVWMTVYAIAGYIAGILEALLKGSDIPLYWFLVATSIGAGLVLMLLSPLIKRLMHGAA